jgi:NAD(P)-dependent dehydrogenase (short-subunit alcohol dehydrogenase family)
MTSLNTVFVTGGASGIGFAVAQAVVSQGWRVVAADVNHDSLEQARARLGPNQPLVRIAQLDVTDERAVCDALAGCEAEFGPLTGVVNSAGIGADVPCLDTSTALFRKIVEVNLIGSFVVAREAARLMAPRRRGSIVNIASVSGMRGNRGRVAYGASKAGIILATQVMAVELASVGVRVNALAPGPIETPLVLQMHTEQSRAGWIDAVPQRRYGTPEEIAAAAMFLLDESRSSYVTGQTICVDGGFTAVGLNYGAHQDGA